MKITIEIPDDLIEIVGCSVNCDYWAEYRTTETGEMEFREVETTEFSDTAQPGPWIELTDERRQRGLELMASKAPNQFGQALAGNADSSTGDIWLQLAIIGEVKYG